MSATQRLERGGDSPSHASFTGAGRETTANTSNKRLHMHDGVTAGGHPHALIADMQNLAGVAALATGTDTIAITLNPAPTALAVYQEFVFEAANNNTGPATLNVNGLGAKAIKKKFGTEDLEADDLVAGGIYRVAYDGTNFQIVNKVGGQERPPILLQSAVITSAQSTIDLTTDFTNTDWDAIEIEVADLHLVSTAQLYGRVRSGGSFQTAAGDYRWGRMRKEVSTSTLTSSEGSLSDSKIELTASSSTGATVAIDGVIRLFRPTGATYFRNIFADMTSWNVTQVRREWSIAQFRNNDVIAAIDGFRLYASTGDIDAARIAVKGIKFT